MVLGQASKRRIIKSLAGLTYIFWVLQLLWICMLYLQTFFQSPMGKLIKPDTVVVEIPDQTQSMTSSGFSLPEPLLIAIVVVAGLALIFAAIYVVFRSYIPEVQRVARSSVQKVAEVSAEQAVRHHIAPKKKRALLTVRLQFWIKLLFSLLPVCVIYGLQDSTAYVPRLVAEIVTVLLALCALIPVILQYFLMERWKIYQEAE